MQRRPFRFVWILLLASGGCTVDFPFDPTAPFEPLLGALNQAQKDFGDALADPLDSKPFPVLVGGDSERVFYATTLTDIRVRVPGPINDFVIGSFFGPSNLYEWKSGERTLLRPLVPSGAVAGIATDGRHLAYVAIADPDLDPLKLRLVVGGLDVLHDRVLFETSDASVQFVSPQIKLDAGRIAYVIMDVGTPDAGQTLHVESLTEPADTRTITADGIGTIDLFGDYLMYEAVDDGVRRVVLLNLRSGEETVLAERVGGPTSVILAQNTAVWSETIDTGVQRIFAYDIPTGETRVWADAVSGTLTGATDTVFITEQRVQESRRRPVQLEISRHDLDGRVRQLARFRADGLAGQSQILGDRAVFVKPDRQVVLVPLADGRRKSFAPF